MLYNRILNTRDGQTFRIDINNNGDFEALERFKREHFNGDFYTTSIRIPEVSEYNRVYRMRIAISQDYSAIGPCDESIWGEYHDYGLFIEPTENFQPIADFTVSDRDISVGDTIQLFDQSIGGAEECKWYPGTYMSAEYVNSTIESVNPQVYYTNPGVYNVKLEVENYFGESSIVKEKHITVRNPYNICDDEVLGNDFGMIFDPGGQDLAYGQNENCTIKKSFCEGAISYGFQKFDLGEGDTIRVFDASGYYNRVFTKTSTFSSRVIDTVSIMDNELTFHFTSDESDEGDFELFYQFHSTNEVYEIDTVLFYGKYTG